MIEKIFGLFLIGLAIVMFTVSWRMLQTKGKVLFCIMCFSFVWYTSSFLVACGFAVVVVVLFSAGSGDGGDDNNNSVYQAARGFLT